MENKFRYYDPFNEVMIYSANFSCLSAFFESYEKTKEGENNPVLMYGSGLPDKDDIEIYDGDILIAKFGKIHTVTYKGASFRCGVNGGNVSYQLWGSLLIIGNIHQKP